MSDAEDDFEAADEMGEGCEPDPDYKVGYKCPPKQHQFKKGQPSANRRGRPRKPRHEAEMLRGELKSKVPVVIEGKQRHLPKERVIIIGLVNAAMRGDMKAIAQLEKMKARLGIGDDPPLPAQVTIQVEFVSPGADGPLLLGPPPFNKLKD